MITIAAIDGLDLHENEVTELSINSERRRSDTPKLEAAS